TFLSLTQSPPSVFSISISFSGIFTTHSRSVRSICSRTCWRAPQKDEGKRDPLLSADDERRLRDNSEREIRELDEAVREAVAG
ncbi:hypothetical protein ACSLOT_27965, partial [Escherichia coli]|uniref:hypothetical protein n=1 Tax=Escherichia coli TaxID=562 RepID=UPI003EE4059A